MFYPQEIIEQVLESTNIVELISQYVKLTKKGSTYFGLCPFHNEKTPSFAVTDNADKKIFYCFGCHTGGSAITFLMKYENLSYTEALKVLAGRAGIKLPEPRYSAEESAKYKQKEEILKVYKEAAVYYYHLLRTEKGRAAMAYLKKRQLSDETILGFGLGYSDKYKDDLYRYVKNKGFSDEVLKASGLFSIKEKGTYDYFWNRVMFPIMDTRNRVIAFGARVMGDGEPKYLNSPETAVFEKRKTLYGLNIASRQKRREFILCEGYMDVISLHQAGFTNAVASLGTALTPGHAATIKKYVTSVVLSYDSDNAGKNAAVRAIPILRGAGLTVKVIDLNPYKDPDELIKAEGAESYGNRLKNARNSLLFEIDVLKESCNLQDPDDRTRFYNETAKMLGNLEDEIERENYLQTVSREYGIDYKLLRDRTIKYALSADPSVRYTVPDTASHGQLAEMNDGQTWMYGERTGMYDNLLGNYDEQAGIYDNRAGKKGVSAQRRKMVQSMRYVLSFLAGHPSYFGQISNILDPSDFQPEPWHTIASEMFAQLKQGKLNITGIIGAFADERMQEEAAQVLGGAGQDASTIFGGGTNQGLAQSFGEGSYHNLVTDDDRNRMLRDCVINIKSQSIDTQMENENDISEVLKLKKEKENLKNMEFPW